MANLNKILDEAITNIRSDRDKAESLLKDAANWVGQNQDRHAQIGLVLSKYLETLQRSNEQLVKIDGIMKSKINTEYGDLDKGEKEDIYNELEEPKDGEK